jgi:hypothetical protein
MRVSGQTKGKKIPRFKTREEEAEFWDTHSPLEYGDWEEVKLEFVQPLEHTLAIRLDARTIDRLWHAAQSKGLGMSTLARMWLLERLEEEAPKKQPVKPAKRRRSA